MLNCCFCRTFHNLASHSIGRQTAAWSKRAYISMTVINWINGEGSGIWGEAGGSVSTETELLSLRVEGNGSGGVMRELGGGTQLNMDEEKLS